MVLAGKSLELGPGLSVGFDETGAAKVSVAGGDGNGQRPSVEQIEGAVMQAREAALQHVAFLTLWLMSAARTERPAIVVPSAGDVANIRKFRT